MWPLWSANMPFASPLPLATTWNTWLGKASLGLRTLWISLWTTITCQKHGSREQRLSYLPTRHSHYSQYLRWHLAIAYATFFSKSIICCTLTKLASCTTFSLCTVSLRTTWWALYLCHSLPEANCWFLSILLPLSSCSTEGKLDLSRNNVQCTWLGVQRDFIFTKYDTHRNW